MRTRSSKSYALTELDEYEKAGHGLLDTIEESFYLDDGQSDLGEEEEADSGEVPTTRLKSPVEEEKEDLRSTQQPRRLVVKLRLPRKNATPTLLPGLERNESVLDEARPSLIVMLRMPPAGQVKAVDGDETMPRLDSCELPNAAAGYISDPISESKHEDLETISLGVHDMTVLPHHSVQVHESNGFPQVQEDARSEGKGEMGQPVKQQIDAEPGESSQEGHAHDAADNSSSPDDLEDQNINVAAYKEDEQIVSCRTSGIMIEDQNAVHDEGNASGDIEEGVIVAQPQESEARVELAESEVVEPHGEALPNIGAGTHTLRDESSLEESSPNSSHFGVDSWPTTEAQDDQSADILPTPLTMLSPDPSVLDSATSPPEASQVSRSVKHSSVREVTPPPSEERSLALQDSPFLSEKRNLPHEDLSSQSKKRAYPLEAAPYQPKKSRLSNKDDSSRSRKRSHPVAGLPSHDEKRSLSSEDAPSRLKICSLPLQNAPSQSKKGRLTLEAAPSRLDNPDALLENVSHHSKKRSFPLDDTEERPRKKHRRRKKEGAIEKKKSESHDLQQAPREIGVVSAGQTAQKGANAHPTFSSTAADGTSHKSQQKSRKVVKKPPQKSGRDQLLEQRKAYASQRSQGGNKSRTQMSSAARRRRDLYKNHS